jgi:hypothetical protein
MPSPTGAVPSPPLLTQLCVPHLRAEHLLRPRHTRRLGEIATLLGWRLALPDTLIRSNAEPYAGISWALILSGQVDEAEDYLALPSFAEPTQADSLAGTRQPAGPGDSASSKSPLITHGITPRLTARGHDAGSPTCYSERSCSNTSGGLSCLSTSHP